MAAQRSAWFYVGIGCLVIVVLGVLVIVLGGFWVFRSAKRLEAEMKDPATRTAKVLDVLGADGLPEGYHALASFSVPFVMETAILSDQEPGNDGMVTGFGERGFIYFELIRMGQDREQLREYFEGRSDDPGVLRRNGINVDVSEIIARGVLPGEDVTLMYVTQRGSVSTQGMQTDGITAVMLVECPDDERGRIAIWFGPDPEPGGELDESDLAGSPGDPAEIGRFMGHFDLCKAS